MSRVIQVAVILALRVILSANANEIVQKFVLLIARTKLPGSSKQQLTVNGTSPGPLLNITYGNWVEVEVVNNLETEATAIHWQGITHHGNYII